MNNKYMVTNGYNEVGLVNTLAEAETLCEQYCNQNGVGYELKRKIKQAGVTVLIYQYNTLYLEVFVIKEGYELSKV